MSLSKSKKNDLLLCLTVGASVLFLAVSGFFLLKYGSSVWDADTPNRVSAHYSKIVSMKFPERAPDFYEDTHGGFLGDGDTVLIYELTDEENQQILREISVGSLWKRLPLPENYDNFLFNGSILKSEIGNLPEGYYCLYDKQQKRFNDSVGNFLSNFIYYQYSPALQKLYVQEFDS